MNNHLVVSKTDLKLAVDTLEQGDIGGLYSQLMGLLECCTDCDKRVAGAAPELLAALIELRADWDTLTRQDYAEGNEDVIKLARQTDDAITKATGDTK